MVCAAFGVLRFLRFAFCVLCFVFVTWFVCCCVFCVCVVRITCSILRFVFALVFRALGFEFCVELVVGF